ncbi:hypothetical protein V6N13_024844 [Hibiscus sabdariffa]|uniref:Uncharacterized protein n=1 Tax=Hibiscus sabdariffa TaxID=183260 RepID=A0ABR2A674_9ROSI
MENLSVAASLNVDTGGLGNHSGRPPDNVIALDAPSTLKHPQSPSATEFQPTNKKGHCLGSSIKIGDFTAEEQGDLDMNMRDGYSNSMEILDGTISPNSIDQNVGAAAGGGSLPVLPTFKDKLLGSAGLIKDSAPLNDLDVDVREEDVRRRNMVYESRFDVLADGLDHNDDGMNQAPTNNNIRKEIFGVNTDLPYDRIGQVVPTDTRLQEHTQVPARMGKVASVGKVIASKTSLNTSKNIVVQVLELGMNSGSKEIKGRILPNSLKGGSSKINMKEPEINSILKQLGPKQKRREDRGVGKPSLASGISKLVEDLNNAEVLEIARQWPTSSTIQGVDARVNWIPNSTFEQ